jgi:hypothetical protein
MSRLVRETKDHLSNEDQRTWSAGGRHGVEIKSCCATVTGDGKHHSRVLKDLHMKEERSLKGTRYDRLAAAVVFEFELEGSYSLVLDWQKRDLLSS